MNTGRNGTEHWGKENRLMGNYRERRKQLGLTQEQLAEMAGITLRSVQYIESGACSPKLEAWFAIQTILADENDGRYYFEWNPDALREARRARKLTQAELAEKMGVARTTVEHWENDMMHFPPTVGNLEMICFITKKPVDVFFRKKEKEDYVMPPKGRRKTA